MLPSGPRVTLRNDLSGSSLPGPTSFVAAPNPKGSPSQTGEKGRFLGREESAVDALELFERAEPELDLAPIVLVADLDGRA